MNTPPRLLDAARPFRIPLALLSAALLAGCADDQGGALQTVKAHPVSGRVLLPDGQPLAQGTVTFVPVGEKGRQASGAVRPDGTFTLTTDEDGDGAGEGEYRVRVISTQSKPGPRKTSVAVVPRKYEDEGSSGLVATIKPGTNALEPFRLNDTKTVVRKSKHAPDRD
jgi:hypothetical protein